MPNFDARSTGLSRRSLIAGALGLTAATAGGGLLSACSSSSSARGAAAGAGQAAPSVTLGPKLTTVQYPEGYVGPVARELKPILEFLKFATKNLNLTTTLIIQTRLSGRLESARDANCVSR